MVLSRLITSLCHDFRDWLQDSLIEWSVLIDWNRFKSWLVGFEVGACFQAWLLYSNTCFRQNLPVTIWHSDGGHIHMVDI